MHMKGEYIIMADNQRTIEEINLELLQDDQITTETLDELSNGKGDDE